MHIWYIANIGTSSEQRGLCLYFLTSFYRHPLLIKLQQSVSIWRSWDRLKQLTHHVKIRDTLNGYLQRDCQKHSQPLWARSHVPEGDKDGILSLIVHCGRAQETAFYDLAYRRQIQEDDDHILWKESDVLIDLLHSVHSYQVTAAEFSSYSLN